MRRFSLLIAASLFGVACTNQGPTNDPNDGAIHLFDLGQSNPYGRAESSTPQLGSRLKSEGGGGKYAPTIDALNKQVRTRWAHREIHEEVDGVDVDAVFAALREESAAARDRHGFRVAVDRALCRLGDGNFQRVKKQRRAHDTGLAVRAVGAALIIESVDERYGNGLSAGDLVLSVDGQPVADWVRTRCVQAGSTPGQRMALHARALERASKNPATRPSTITVRRAKSGKTSSKVELRWGRVQDPACVAGRELASNVGIVEVRRLDCDARAFEEGLEQALAAADREHVLLDLRRVWGDDEDNAKRVAQSFASSREVWATTREGTTGGFVNESLSSQTTSVAGRRWLLISARCAGACEMLASVVASDPAVASVGRTTAGSVARPETISLGGDLEVRVPTSQFALPGTDMVLEAHGVTPDLEVTATIDELARGRDPEVVAVARRMREG